MTAWLRPVRIDVSEVGRATSSASVPARYTNAIETAAAKMARGMVFRGSTISSETRGASSNPANAKQSFEKARTSARSVKRGTSDASRMGFADPNRASDSAAITSRNTIGSQFAAPPRF